jgi:hypothetical protein
MQATIKLHTAKTADEVNKLIEKGEDMNALDRNGNTPLHWAAIMKNKEVFNALCLAGACLQIKNWEDKMPFEYLKLETKDCVCPVCWIPDGPSHMFCGRDEYKHSGNCSYCGASVFGSDYANHNFCSKTCLNLTMKMD